MKFGHCMFLLQKSKHASCTEYCFCFRASRANKRFFSETNKGRDDSEWLGGPKASGKKIIFPK